ncbi:NHL repeat-containing protein [Thalassoroseus pseudoceratinae]|uniref:NHL repeat-containing protein n=1 Tax=Thalassoroseus pseudoceratinae TaxID=2713176 RepID=UPI001423AEF4|nr:NHL repeat-containing protein [Thalassoroseus pseudoceratinae]
MALRTLRPNAKILAAFVPMWLCLLDLAIADPPQIEVHVPFERQNPSSIYSNIAEATRDISQLDNGETHHHHPVRLNARPIVSRFDVALSKPRRVLISPDGSMLVADWGADVVLKITTTSEVTVFASNLHEPAGLARDAAGNLYVANHASGIAGEGTVVKISPGGMPIVFADGLCGPTGLAFDPQGTLFVADFQGDRIVRITPDGDSQTFVDELPTPAALAFDQHGYLYTASSTEGTVYRIDAMGNRFIVCQGLTVPSDLAFDSQGHLIVTNYGGTELTYVDPMGTGRIFATVPKGTIGLDFDADGNLVFVNWDFQTLMKITMNLQIPCPHCGQTIPLQLRPRQPKPTRSKPSGPVI